MRVQTAIVTFGLCLPLLTASAAGNASESALRAAAATVDQVALHDRRDSTTTPRVAAAMLLTERVTFVARARESTPPAMASATAPLAEDDASGEPHPLMMLLSALALIAYVIGRRGIQRG